MTTDASPVLVIGLGNAMRRDDGVGPAAIEILDREQLGEADTITLDGESTRLIEAWTGRQRAIVIDAVATGDAAGTIHEVEVGHDALPDWAAGASTHGAGIAEAVALGRALDRLPAELVVFGVEPDDLSHGPGLSVAVETALPDLVARVKAMVRSRRRLRVAGVVQGVGFRPFVHHLAGELGLSGSVVNDADGVTIEIEGPSAQLDRFADRLMTDAPPLARITGIESDEVDLRHTVGFHIATSPGGATETAPSVPPDTAVCADCLAELRYPHDRRYRHPFITCTNCGPRFTIITGLPYDRPDTTMRGFPMCGRCATEYEDPSDRRHHAQPIACPDCGPTLLHRRGERVTAGTDEVVAAVQDDLAGGRIVAVKGVGGYHLVADATDEDAITLLRARKHRPDKPFAVMVADLDTAGLVAEIDEADARALTSAASPIVLVRARPDSPVSPLVAPGNPLIGVMLPSTPLHHLLFDPVPDHLGVVPRVLVMTSGNVAGEPICHDDADAAERLDPLVDSFCSHDRPISVPCDDSVVRLVGGAVVPLRRSRGHVPLPVQFPFEVPPMLAVGGEIKNAFCLARGRRAFMSQHLGDMENLPSLRALGSSVTLLRELYGVDPTIVATDLHPGYHSRRWAREWADERADVAVVEVQHHHAHLASLMVEHGLDGTEPVIGIAFDGTGYGSDGALWGGEVLAGGYAEVERWCHLVPVPLPGGDASVREPWRVALAHLRAAEVDHRPLLVGAAEPDAQRVVEQQIVRDLACPPTTSMGRLFDAVASMLGLRHRITYEAQAAIELEHLAASADGVPPPLAFSIGEDRTFDAAPMVRELVGLLTAGTDRRALALAFHQAVADLIADLAVAVRRERGLSTVGLTGGVFQNDLLTTMAIAGLEERGFSVLTHRAVPPNDGGIALGQIAVAAHHGGH